MLICYNLVERMDESMKKRTLLLALFTCFSLTSFLSISAEESQKSFEKGNYKGGSKHAFIQQYTIESSKLSFLDKKEELPLIEAETEKTLFYVDDVIDSNYIVEYPFLTNDYFDVSIKNRISNYNAIAKSNPDIKIYIYQATNARDTIWFDSANYIEGAVPAYNKQLFEAIDDSITFKNMQYGNWYQYRLQNYRTDHHWNVFGAYHGYIDIIDMLKKDFSEIKNAKTPKSYYCSNVQFHGSLADNNPENYDTICEFEYNLPEYTITLNGNEVEEYGNRSTYKSTVEDTDPSINHYREFFGKDSAEVIYQSGNKTGLNALIISDSYSNAIKPVLSSHFDTTVYIDLRHYLGEYDEFFNLAKYHDKYDFDIIIYLGGFYTTIMDECYMINYY